MTPDWHILNEIHISKHAWAQGCVLCPNYRYKYLWRGLKVGDDQEYFAIVLQTIERFEIPALSIPK